MSSNKSSQMDIKFFPFFIDNFPFFCHAVVVVVSSLMSKRKSKEEILLQSKTIKWTSGAAFIVIYTVLLRDIVLINVKVPL